MSCYTGSSRDGALNDVCMQCMCHDSFGSYCDVLELCPLKNNSENGGYNGSRACDLLDLSKPVYESHCADKNKDKNQAEFGKFLNINCKRTNLTIIFFRLY